MPGYTVLLEKWSPLPHKELGKDISAITAIHLQTIYTRLRLQQGIIAENLELDLAETLAKFLTDSGYPSIVINNSDVFTPGRVILCRNADIVDGEIRIEDPYGNMSTLDIDRISFVHVGWVDEKDKPSDSRKHYFGNMVPSRYGPVEGFPMNVRQNTSSIGWVLHLFSDEFGVDYLRISYNRFNYDYQQSGEESREKRFRRLLYDLKNLIPIEKLDESFIAALMCGGEIPDHLEFENMDALMKRIVWLQTLNKFHK